MKKGVRIHTVARGSGFTLIELMVTVALVAILAVIAAPALGNFVSRSEMNGLENDFYGALQRARVEAISRNTCVAICRAVTSADAVPAQQCGGRSEDWSGGWIVYQSATCNNDETPQPAAFIQVRAALRSGYTLGANRNLNKIIFNAQGHLLARNITTFRLVNTRATDNSQNRQFALSAAGRVMRVPYIPPESEE